MARLSSELYKWARLSRDIEVLLSGDLDKIVKRWLNKWLGRNIVRRLWLK